ncbi:CaiB/BaiF CoA transferase family protein [Noviherbaspirillum saxi]|uniref:CoA transferase n=1 Tax=Noviherbaspirillum saxi TaxID=2320863 RepID=A0A3A3FPC5_9BURK|nr:CaiB/BaiF CoA-transferase family protein [Noviherbaspirillum saxi]RJF95539.1 CoA transferase [Noviherbaspirillum saxi]
MTHSQPYTPAASGPLSGIRILDMATVLAAPFSATLCGDMGAEVIKLELPDGSDSLRTLAPVDLFWKVTNRGKKGITLDVRKPEGKALFLKLVATVDVLVENFRTGTLDKWGLDIATLHAANPKLIVLRLTGFGQTGPYAARPGFARIFEAMSGFANLTGDMQSGPQHMNYPLGDVVSGLFGAFSIASAIAQRALHPQQHGVEIDLSATEAMLRLLDPLAAEYESEGVSRQRAGNRATYTAPSNMYRTGDGAYITVVGSTAIIFRRLCNAMQRPELADDERFCSNPARMKHVDELDGIIAQWCLAHSYAAIANALEEHGVPFSKIYSIADVVADPHYQSRQALIRLPDPEHGSLPAPCIVPRMTGFEPAPPRTGPALGEHNEEILSSLGVPGNEIDRLRSAGVI